MAQKVMVPTPTGVREMLAYDDYREIESEMYRGTLANGADIIYRGVFCTVIGWITNPDGTRNTELLATAYGNFIMT